MPTEKPRYNRNANVEPLIHNRLPKKKAMMDIVTADLHSPNHCSDIVRLLDGYAKDIMEGGEQLSEYTKANLTSELAKREGCIVFLTYVEQEAAGLVICFEGFSTFVCQPILNIHDLMVDQKYRGRGLCVGLLEKTESVAKERGCCKMTLEVLEGNHRARTSRRSCCTC